MRATHSIKVVDSTLQINSICADLVDPPLHLIHSATIKAKQEYWACPRNAADMKTWLNSDAEPVRYLPPLTLEKKNRKFIEPSIPLKQIFTPTQNWKNGEYVITTPAYSLSLFNEVYFRLLDNKLPFQKWVIQPTPAAFANHGELILQQKGSIRLFKKGLVPTKNKVKSNKTKLIEVTASCEGLNLASSLIGLGFPALTGIGGAVHILEREIKRDLPFAIGFTDRISWNLSALKGTNLKAGEPTPSVITTEISGNANVVIVIKVEHLKDTEIDTVLNSLKRLNKISGANVFNLKSRILSDFDEVIEATFLKDASNELNEYEDKLSGAIELYAKDGEWVREEDGEIKWYCNGNGRTVVHCGYSFLEEPSIKNGTRNNNKHAWSEALFTLIDQSELSDKCFWGKYIYKHGFYYRHFL